MLRFHDNLDHLTNYREVHPGRHLRARNSRCENGCVHGELAGIHVNTSQRRGGLSGKRFMVDDDHLVVPAQNQVCRTDNDSSDLRPLKDWILMMRSRTLEAQLKPNIKPIGGVNNSRRVDAAMDIKPLK